MIRFGLIGFIIELALTIYALIDVIRTDESQIRGLPKFAWIILIILLPVVGAVVWLVAGKERDESRAARSTDPRAWRPGRPSSPDDDPRFGRSPMTDDEIDAYIRGDDSHIRELEDRLRELDRETFPGEKPGGSAEPAGGGATGSTSRSDAAASPGDSEAGADPGRAAGEPDDPRAER